MSHHSSALIAAHLLSSLGMNASALEDAQLRRAIRRRMDVAGLRSMEAYTEHYRTSPSEQALLAEEVYIHETCFFRDRAVFTETVRWVQQWLAAHTGPISVLSAPCSTGEEPYSIAAALLAAGVPSGSIAIHAVDVSEHALSAARRGVYSGMSLRNVPDPASESFLVKSSSGYEVIREVRAPITFERVNLLDADALPDAAYDLVFCRNLLIYLDPTARARVAHLLRRALRPGGRLVLGAADWSSDLQPFFSMEGPANAFSFRPAAKPEKDTAANPAQAPEVQFIPQPARAGDAHTLYELARSAAEQDALLAERLCRQALYLQGDHLPSLELLSRLWQSRASRRLNHALDARLRRRRQLVCEAV